MQIEQVYRELTELFRDVFADDAITLRPEMVADDIEAWDSFTHLSLIVAIEGKFGIKFDTAEMEGVSSVGDLASTIARKAH